MQRILILAAINSSHTQRWVSALLSCGFDIRVFSFTPLIKDFAGRDKIQVIVPKKKLSFLGDKRSTKLSYLFSLPDLKKCIKEFAPDVVHAHYATSYGLLGALSGFSPFFISVWGSDVLSFPQKSILHKKLLGYSMSRADRVFATSVILHDEVLRLYKINSTIIPFGIDIDVFYPHRNQIYFSNSELVIGSIKSMEPVYRMDWIIRAFAEAQRLRPILKMRLLLVGGGSQLQEMVTLAQELCLPDTYKFTGRVQYSEIPELTAQLDIFVHAAINESFGVSTLEAASCAKASVVCESGGAKEVVIPNQTALLYDESDFNGLVTQLLKLIDDETLRREIGKSARAFVENKFNWKNNVNDMIMAYQSVNDYKEA